MLSICDQSNEDTKGTARQHGEGVERAERGRTLPARLWRTPRLLVAEQGSRWVTGRNISVCGVTSGDHYVQSERRRKCRPIEIDGTRLLPRSFE